MLKKIGIIGVGMVGGALRRYFGTVDDKELFIYDKFQELGSLEEVNKAEVIFVCVPTPFDEEKGYCDLSAVEDAFSNIKGEKIVVIKSTVLPGTSDYFQEKYPQLKVLHNPEFLTEATAEQDMRYPDRQLVGYTNEASHRVAGDIMQLLPLAPFCRILPAKETETIKYFGNTWFSTKVIFANQMYDLCEKLGISYDNVKEAAGADKRVGRSHLEVWHKGKRGYAGKCLVGQETIFQYTDQGLKVTKIKDFEGDRILSSKGGEIIVDRVVAKSKRKIRKTIKVSLSKGRKLEMSPDHLVVVFDQKDRRIIKEAQDLNKEDRIPVVMNKLPALIPDKKINFFQNFRFKERVFVEEVDKNHSQQLKPFLTFHQYKGLRRKRKVSIQAVAVKEAGLSLKGLKVKTGKTGNWVPAQQAINKDLARLIGYYLAEGCVSEERVFFSFGYHEKELLEDVSSILDQMEVSYSTQIGRWKGKKSSYTFKVSSPILSEYFEQFGSDSYSKSIPGYLFFMPQEIKDNLLAGLIRGDGSVGGSNMGDYYSVDYATVSKELIEGIDLLLREKGILASKRTFRSKKSKVPCYEVRVSESDSVQELLPLLTENKKDKIDLQVRSIKSPAYERIDDQTALLNIKEIEERSDPKWVYALETQSSFYLTSGGILTHNCLPKDIKALIKFADKKDVDLKVHKVVDRINDKLLKEQGIEDPEKHSKRL